MHRTLQLLENALRKMQSLDIGGKNKKVILCLEILKQFYITQRPKKKSLRGM